MLPLIATILPSSFQGCSLEQDTDVDDRYMNGPTDYQMESNRLELEESIFSVKFFHGCLRNRFRERREMHTMLIASSSPHLLPDSRRPAEDDTQDFASVDCSD